MEEITGPGSGIIKTVKSEMGSRDAITLTGVTFMSAPMWEKEEGGPWWGGSIERVVD